MAISSFYGLQTSLRGLLAQQRALDTTGHNIANASTPGYSRQEAVMAASAATRVEAGAVQGGYGAHIGSGVDVQAYRRIRDTFLDLQYRGQATKLGEWAARSEGMERAELSLAEPGENGINEQLARFWSAWSDLAKAPDEPAAQQALLEQGATLAAAFNSVAEQMETVAQQARAEYDDLVRPAGTGDAGGKVTQLATEIAQLNETIKRFVTAGDTPTDLLDRRDLLVDELSSLGQVSVTALPTGSLQIAFGGLSATPLVDDTTVNWAAAPAPGAWTPGGRLAGLQELFQPGRSLDALRDDLDAVATSLMSSVNGVLTAAGSPAFFAGTGAGDLAVAAAARTSPGALAAPPGSAAGDNRLANAIAGQRDGAADGAYRSFVARTGAEVREATRQEANAQVLVDAVDGRRQSVSGVSLDEEMTNLVRFQRAYQASSRAMSTMDEMLDVLINRTGRVGL
jgi:flagellar hook-associated protein 1